MREITVYAVSYDTDEDVAIEKIFGRKVDAENYIKEVGESWLYIVPHPILIED